MLASKRKKDELMSKEIMLFSEAPILAEVAIDVIESAESEKSQRIYRLDLIHFWKWVREQDIDYQYMKESDARHYKTHLQEQFAKATAQRMLSVAKLLFLKLMNRGLLTYNPFAEIKPFRLSNESSHMSLSIEQVRDLLASVNVATEKGMRDYSILSLLVRTGLRRAECVAINVGDLGKERGHNIVTIQHGKGDKRRKVKIPNEVFHTLEEYMKTRKVNALSDPLFVGFDRRSQYAGKRISDKVIERIAREYGKKIGIVRPPLTPHDLRATFITLALEGKAPLTKVQYAAGHADPRTTERYQTRKENLDDNAVDYIHL